MAAIIRICSRVTLRSLHSFPRLSRSSNQVVLSPLLRNSVKIEWSCNFNAKYLCSFTKSTIDNAQLNATAKEAGGESGLIEIGSLSNDSDDYELISSSSNDLFRISQRLGSVRREETLLEAFEVIKGIEGVLKKSFFQLCCSFFISFYFFNTFLSLQNLKWAQVGWGLGFRSDCPARVHSV